ncbi:RNA polymerase sigma factor [Arcticibacter sp. MXS-1]|uniref:RNA polymerase sigma factor n=1 Tax=Arcticibacter sp. MXS-1 TaxID=3341726 RepID=UPI0035A9AA1D
MQIKTEQGFVDVRELWTRFLQGDEEAYNCIMRSFARPLFNYGIRFSTDRDLVKDCIQDVFFDLWNKRSRISETAYVQAYLLKSLRLRILRERKKWDPMESLETIPFAADFGIEMKMIEDQSNLELRQRVKKVLNTLSERQKEIVYLRFYQSLSHDKISLVMGLTRQSAYNLLQKALIKMRKEWETAALVLFLIGLK